MIEIRLRSTGELVGFSTYAPHAGPFLCHYRLVSPPFSVEYQRLEYSSIAWGETSIRILLVDHPRELEGLDHVVLLADIFKHYRKV